MKLSNLALTLMIASTSSTAMADESKPFRWGIGVAAVAQDQGYTDVGNETVVVPVVAIEYGNFSLLGPRANYKLYQSENFELSASAQLRMDGYEEDDGDIFKGMEDRDMAFDAGFEAEIDTSFGEFGLELMHDLTSTHEGFEFSASYGIPFRLEKGRVVPYISANYQSDKMVDYYYGVRAEEATASRQFYEPDAATSFEIGISSDWYFGRGKHMIKADISYSAYGSEIKDSPLVDKSGSTQLLLGYVYVF